MEGVRHGRSAGAHAGPDEGIPRAGARSRALPSGPGTGTGTGTNSVHTGAVTLELVVLVGLQGAGKSTFYRTRLAATHAIVSKDLMGRRARDKQGRQLRELAAHLAAGRSVVVDNTNPTAADRAPLVAVGRAHGARVVCYGFALDVAGSHLRNRQRLGRACVPDVALFGTLARLEAPGPGEGFDARFVVHLDGHGGFDVRPVG